MNITIQQALENGKERYSNAGEWLFGKIIEIKKEPYGPYNKNFIVALEKGGLYEGILKEGSYDPSLKVGDRVKVQLYSNLVDKIKKA
jgi:hypothetical protein